MTIGIQSRVKIRSVRDWWFLVDPEQLAQKILLTYLTTSRKQHSCNAEAYLSLYMRSDSMKPFPFSQARTTRVDCPSFSSSRVLQSNRFILFQRKNNSISSFFCSFQGKGKSYCVMLILLLLEFNIEDTFANGESAQLFYLFDLLFTCLLIYHLQVLQCPIAVAGISQFAEGNILKLIQVLQLILQFLQQLRSLLLLLQFSLELDCLVAFDVNLRSFAVLSKPYIVLARMLDREGIIEYVSGIMKIMNKCVSLFLDLFQVGLLFHVDHAGMTDGVVQSLEVLFESFAVFVETVPLQLADQAVDHLVFALIDTLGE